MRSWLALGLGALWVLAQEPKLLQNTGKPILVDFQCTEDDMQWAGMSCSEDEPCPVYLEVSAIEVVGNRIFCSGNIHTASITLYSVLLASHDAGKTWHEPHDRIRGAGLDHIQFVDFESGRISGQLLQPLPQDPFLLITSDGGKTWRHRPIFGENRMGSVQQFWFDSRNNGRLVIDRSQSGEGTRFELYETPNGGETWMIRQASDRPIALKREAGSSNPDWRIRADGPSKSFCIEHRQGDRWIAAAGFLVPIGQCKPAEKVATPPPEPAPPPSETAAPTPPAKPPSLKRPPR
jgi:hypothetical protein